MNRPLGYLEIGRDAYIARSDSRNVLSALNKAVYLRFLETKIICDGITSLTAPSMSKEVFCEGSHLRQLSSRYKCLNFPTLKLSLVELELAHFFVVVHSFLNYLFVAQQLP